MKRIVGALIIAVLAPVLARADLLIYKGTAKESYLGDGHQLKVTSKVILIIDRDTANVSRLQYATISGYKTYYTAQTTNLHFVQISGANGKSSTVIAHLPSECDQKEDPGSEGVHLAGANGTVSPDGKATVVFPKLLTGGGRGLFHSDSSNAPMLGEMSVTVSFNQADTVTSNNTGETQEAALARYEAWVQSQGYTQ